MVHPSASNISWGLQTFQKWSLKSQMTNHSVKITTNIMETDWVLILTAQERGELLLLNSLLSQSFFI